MLASFGDRIKKQKKEALRHILEAIEPSCMEYAIQVASSPYQRQQILDWTAQMDPETMQLTRAPQECIDRKNRHGNLMCSHSVCRQGFQCPIDNTVVANDSYDGAELMNALGRKTRKDVLGTPEPRDIQTISTRVSKFVIAPLMCGKHRGPWMAFSSAIGGYLECLTATKDDWIELLETSLRIARDKKWTTGDDYRCLVFMMYVLQWVERHRVLEAPPSETKKAVQKLSMAETLQLPLPPVPSRQPANEALRKEAHEIYGAVERTHVMQGLQKLDTAPSKRHKRDDGGAGPGIAAAAAAATSIPEKVPPKTEPKKKSKSKAPGIELPNAPGPSMYGTMWAPMGWAGGSPGQPAFSPMMFPSMGMQMPMGMPMPMTMPMTMSMAMPMPMAMSQPMAAPLGGAGAGSGSSSESGSD